jgi:hypothetical protein
MADPNVIAQQGIAPAVIGAPLGGVDHLLDVVGFHNPAEHLRIIEAGLTDYEDFHYLVDKDIRNMAEEFAKQLVAQGCITFGLGRIKKLTGLMHWVQDCFCTNADPNNMIFNEEALAEAQSCALICKSDINLVDTRPILASSETSASGLSGTKLLPIISLSFLALAEFPYCTLFGQYYEADSRHVHNLLTGFLHGEPTETWICSRSRFQDGRRDILALRHHYAVKGNSTRQITDAKSIQTSLFYKTERALPFNTFLDRLQKMFFIYEDEGEALTERAKVEELLKKVQHASLTVTVAQLRFQLNTAGVTFTVVVNHLNAAVSLTPDYQMTRRGNISSTNT